MQGIWIGGCPRSGTTLLAAMLGNNSNIDTLPECHFKFDLLWMLKQNKDNIEVRQALHQLKQHWQFQHYYDGLELEQVFGIHDTGLMPYADFLLKLYRQYKIKKAQSSQSIWLDHTPENILYGQTLFNLFPQSKMIHIIRDGRAVANSLVKVDWGANTIYHAADCWARSIAAGLAVRLKYGEENVYQLHYEDLVLKPEHTLQKISRFLGMSYEESMLVTDQVPISSVRKQFHQLIGEKTDPNRINHWEKELSSRQIEIFEAQTADLLSLLGYQPRFGTQAKPVSIRERIKLDLQDRINQLINRRQFRKRHKAFLSTNQPSS